MTGGLELAAAPAPSSPRQPGRQTLLVAIGLVLALIGTVAGGYYFALRPEALKIAVGPANSDDIKVVQTLTQAFARAHGYIRLKLVQTDGAVASANALSQGSVDLAIIRGDLDVPKNAQAVATLRKNVVVIWVPPPAKGKRKSGAKISRISQLAGHRIGVVGRTEAKLLARFEKEVAPALMKELDLTVAGRQVPYWMAVDPNGRLAFQEP